MPQHPQYTNSPSRNLEKLYSLLNELEGFGLIHEEIHQNLDSIMTELYPTAARKNAAYESGEEFSEDDDDEDDDVPIPSVSSLFGCVDFDESDPFKYTDLYFNLKNKLENLYKRQVDLIEERAIKNRFFKTSKYSNNI